MTSKVAEILATVVECGGEASGAHLLDTCGLNKAQLTRQLRWMEMQDFVNQVGSWNDGGLWVRATALGRAILAAQP
ncbi:hypothetical protein ACOACQ_02645 [Nocardioides sp. CPCC 206347]|uniref:hypothetical protein n=1 Tax=unclassified Nocardioides TaxID=2615069 RepID=UPI00360D7591